MFDFEEECKLTLKLRSMNQRCRWESFISPRSTTPDQRSAETDMSWARKRAAWWPFNRPLWSPSSPSCPMTYTPKPQIASPTETIHHYNAQMLYLVFFIFPSYPNLTASCGDACNDSCILVYILYQTWSLTMDRFIELGVTGPFASQL